MKNNYKRLGVFVFFDKDGLVDDYVKFMLESLKEAVDDLIIVSNCYLNTKANNDLFVYTDKIMVRPNIGLDAGAFKDVYDKYHQYFLEFDELLLVNDTFYGPFEPFKNICQKMQQKTIDFWGLTANYDSTDGYGFLPDNMIHSHIQTFFIAFRKSVLSSEAFNKYWQEYDICKMNTFIDVVTKHEIFFTHYLEKAGFKWDTYVDLKKYKCDSIEGNFNIYAYCSYDLIKNLNCPFIKRKNFIFDKKDALFLTDGSDARRSLDYLKEKKLYDIDLIMKNLVRLYDTDSLYYGLNLSYIVKENSHVSKKYAIIIYLENEKYFTEYINYIFSKNIKNVYIVTNNSFIMEHLKKNDIKYYNKENINHLDYDYLCLIKDNYFLSQKIRAVYDYAILNVLSNGIYSNEYINGIMDIFDNNKYLGLLILPSDLHSNYFDSLTSNNNKISYSNNCCWINSKIFDWDKFLNYSWINEFKKTLKENNMIIGKIYNVNTVNNNLTTNDYIIINTFKTLKKHHHTITTTYPETIYHIEHSSSNSLPVIKTKFNRIKKIIKKIIKK